MDENFHSAICLLALITQRPPDLDKLLGESQTEGPQSHPVRSQTTVSLANDQDSNLDEYFNVVDEEHDDDFELDVTTGDVKNQVCITELQNKVLDRLAETLARFKSDRRLKGSVLDSKHVASTMMITYDQGTRVEFLCAKNEGLDQEKHSNDNQKGGSRGDDTSFLASWKRHMEGIASQGEFPPRHPDLHSQLCF